MEQYKETIELISEEYINAKNDWYLGYSGGKDSTALLILLLNALHKNINTKCKLHIMYCDTGVEIPLIPDMVKSQFMLLSSELGDISSSVTFQIVSPPVEDRFFSKIIGDGYVPPTFLFRWCTKRLRIKPIQRYINSLNSSTVVLGIRKGESFTRDNVINNHLTNSTYYTKQSGYPNTSIFCPIINYSVKDVWDAIINCTYPYSINREQICSLYKCIGTQFQEDGSFSCDKQQGRYGCWTCTVVKKDKAMEGLIQNGYTHLTPLQDFMNWLRIIRDDTTKRDKNRITGQPGMGPFNLETRKEILKKLLDTQKKSGIELIGSEELSYIYSMWAMYILK